jgi:hypothetical protein
MVLSRFYRRRFLELLNDAFDSGQLQLLSSLASLQSPGAFHQHLALARQKEWVVYAKPPFAGPQQALDYLGRYTHRVAISNNRLVAMDDDSVQFRWKDYADHNQQKVMTVRAHEFIRRFLMHTLPLGLQRIRYYGLFGNRRRAENLTRCRQLLDMPVRETVNTSAPRDYRSRYEALIGRSLHQCPVYLEGCMRLIEQIPRPQCRAAVDTS